MEDFNGDEFLDSKSEVGLGKVKVLFPVPHEIISRAGPPDTRRPHLSPVRREGPGGTYSGVYCIHPDSPSR